MNERFVNLGGERVLLADPIALPEQELMRLRDQIVKNLERAWEITGSGKDGLASMMVQISQVVAKQFKENLS